MSRDTSALRRWLRYLTIIGGSMALIIPVTPATGAIQNDTGRGIRFSGVERCFLRKINRARTVRGYSPLNWDHQLGYVARRHANKIADDRSVYHDGNYTKEITHWTRLGQNTGRGGRCKGLFRAFLESSTHRQNILGTWRFMAVGVARGGGRIYVQQLFESRRNPGNIYGN